MSLVSKDLTMVNWVVFNRDLMLWDLLLSIRYLKYLDIIGRSFCMTIGNNFQMISNDFKWFQFCLFDKGEYIRFNKSAKNTTIRRLGK
jgi:hypothetical protein